MIGSTVIAPVPWAVWAAFIGCVLVFLALDLGLFHREARAVRMKEACAWTLVWAALAMAFAAALVPWRGRQEAVEFVTGYVIEISLSMDNVFVMALIFAYFRVPPPLQHRILFWGILGALVMRGGLIGAGAAVVSRFDWTLYVFGAFLVLSGVRMLTATSQGVQPEKNPAVRLVRRLYPVSSGLDGQKFRTVVNGRRALTPLALALVMVETADLVFASDSIPAIFAVTTKPFIVFTSNVFAILGLRSLYFVLAGAIQYFRCLKYGLSLVLVFIGAKMLFDPHDAPPRWFQFTLSTGKSLAIVGGIIVLSMAVSVWLARQERKSTTPSPGGPADTGTPPSAAV